jgi:hypothetical protein
MRFGWTAANARSDTTICDVMPFMTFYGTPKTAFYPSTAGVAFQYRLLDRLLPMRALWDVFRFVPDRQSITHCFSRDYSTDTEHAETVLSRP